MMGWGEAWRAGALRAMGAVATAVLLASCGGSGDPVETFVPVRVLAFGDENSVIDNNGRKYTVNFVDASTATTPTPHPCAQLQIWVQLVASGYGVPFPQCAAGATSAPSRILAQPNAQAVGANGVAAQIDTFLQGDSFGGKDLVTVMAGANDMIALQAQVGQAGYTFDNAMADAAARGSALAGQVNRIAQAGGKVLISTIPDMGLTPYGRADATRSAQLSAMVREFNTRLRIGLINDGRLIGLVLADEAFRLVTNSTTVNSTDPACDAVTVADVLTCTTQTLRTVNGVAATTSGFLWADDRHMSPGGHANVGSLALTRARGNPF